MTFEEWVKKQYPTMKLKKHDPITMMPSCWEAAWDASRKATIEEIHAIPQRAMFDEGFAAGCQKAIEECTEIAVQWILDQGTIQDGRCDIMPDEIKEIAAAIRQLNQKGESK